MRQAMQGQQPQPLPGGLWRTQPATAGAPVAAAPAPGPARAPQRGAQGDDNPVRAAPAERGFLERLFGGG